MADYSDYTLPKRVRVIPLFLVPNDKFEVNDLPLEKDHLMFREHLTWAQERYKTMLNNRDTFEIEYLKGAKIKVLKLSMNSDYYNSSSEYYKNAPGTYESNNIDTGIAHCLLSAFRVNRFNNPYIFCAIIHHTGVNIGGRPYNGGINSGGGFVIFRYEDKFYNGNFQSTLRHELGHTFGLLHSWQNGYGRELRYSKHYGDSIMSYNPDHHTHNTLRSIDGLKESDHPGILLPEDIRSLSLNKRVFPNLYFDPETDIPSGYEIRRQLGHFGPLELESDQLSANLGIYTAFSEPPPKENMNKIWIENRVEYMVENILQPEIRENSEQVGFDCRTMWKSAVVKSSMWISIRIQFPYAVPLTGAEIHAQCCGQPFKAKLQIAYNSIDTDITQAGNYINVTSKDFEIGADDHVDFPGTPAKIWQFSFFLIPFTEKYDDGEEPFPFNSLYQGRLVIRGLRFFSNGQEIFPHRYPNENHIYPSVKASGFAISNSKETHVVRGYILKSDPEIDFDFTRMWRPGLLTYKNKWFYLDIKFPYPISLCMIWIYSQCLGKDTQVDEIKVEYDNEKSNSLRFSAQMTVKNTFKSAAKQNVMPDAYICFPEQKAAIWRIHFHSNGNEAVIRGLRFFTPAGEVFAPYGAYQYEYKTIQQEPTIPDQRVQNIPEQAANPIERRDPGPA